MNKKRLTETVSQVNNYIIHDQLKKINRRNNMFFVKANVNETTEIRTEITDENVFTICPVCGKEHAVDISEISGDIYSTQVLCSECSFKDNSEV